jgi:hypothetical protein
MTLTITHPLKLTLFALLSAADFALTWWLLSYSRGEVYESNALASWWLSRFGWLGLAGYKAGSVLLVAALCAAIARRRPAAAGRVLLLGCAAAGLVVVYSAGLGWRLCLSPRAGAWGSDDDRRAFNEQALARLAKNRAFDALRAELGEGLAAGAWALRDAGDRLARSELARDAAWRRGTFGDAAGRPLSELVAGLLVREAVMACEGDPAHARRVAHRLGQEFASAYGAPCPVKLPPHLAGADAPGGEDGRGAGAG